MRGDAADNGAGFILLAETCYLNLSDGDRDPGTLEDGAVAMATRDELIAKDERDEQRFRRLEQPLQTIAEQLNSLAVAHNRNDNGDREHPRIDVTCGDPYNRANLDDNNHNYYHLDDESDEDGNSGNLH
ncbi:hypothetical protein Drorol1_Dr00010879 [Drosera rotundifolia]